jgi:hypothetical protein
MQTENDSGIVKSKRAVSREPIDCKYIQDTLRRISLYFLVQAIK